MKNILLGAILFVLFAMPFALAEEVNTFESAVSEENVSTWKVGWERAKLAFTFNQEKKAQLELKLAEMRLIQAKKMAEKGNLKAMEKFQQKYDKLLEKAKERIQKLEEKSGNITKLIGLERAVEVHERNIERFKEKMSEKNLTVEQQEKVENIIAKMQDNVEKLKELQQIKEAIEQNLTTLRKEAKEQVKEKVQKAKDKQTENKSE